MRTANKHNMEFNYQCIYAAWIAGIIILYIFYTGGMWEPAAALFALILRSIADYINEWINHRDSSTTEEQ